AASGPDRRRGLSHGRTPRMSPAGRDGSRPETADPRVRGGRLRGARRRADPGDGPHHLPPPPTASSVPPGSSPPARPLGRDPSGRCPLPARSDRTPRTTSLTPAAAPTAAV